MERDEIRDLIAEWRRLSAQSYLEAEGDTADLLHGFDRGYGLGMKAAADWLERAAGLTGHEAEAV